MNSNQMVVNLVILIFQLWGGTPYSVNFIGVDRFVAIIDSYLVNNIVNHMKNKKKKKKIQVDLFAQSMTSNIGKKTNKTKFSKYLFGMEDFLS